MRSGILLSLLCCLTLMMTSLFTENVPDTPGVTASAALNSDTVQIAGTDAVTDFLEVVDNSSCTQLDVNFDVPLDVSDAYFGFGRSNAYSIFDHVDYVAEHLEHVLLRSNAEAIDLSSNRDSYLLDNSTTEFTISDNMRGAVFHRRDSQLKI